MAAKVKPVEESSWFDRSAEMAIHVEPSEKTVIKAKTKPETQPGLFLKLKKASVIPARKKSVKKMMLDRILQFMASLCICEKTEMSHDSHPTKIKGGFSSSYP